MKSVKNTHASTTEKQLAYAESLARRRGYKHLSDAEKACFGKRKIGGLDRGRMSELIKWLLAGD